MIAKSPLIVKLLLIAQSPHDTSRLGGSESRKGSLMLRYSRLKGAAGVGND